MQIIFHQHLSYLLILSIALLFLLNPVLGYAEENKPPSSNSLEKSQTDSPRSEEDLTSLELIHEALESLNDEINRLKSNRKRSPVKTLKKTQEIIELIEQNLAALTTKIESNKNKTKINRSTLKTIEETIKSIQSNLDEAQANIENNNKLADEVKEEVLVNAKQIEENSAKAKEEFLSKAREVQANENSINELKGLIEENAVRMYETLTKIKSVSENVKKLSEELERIGHVNYIEEIKYEVSITVNKLWSLIAIILVFFVPVAFSLCHNQKSQTVLMVSLAVFLGFFTLGSGLMYGTTTAGWLGTSTYLAELTSDFSTFILYQTGFIMLAAMIVYMILGQQLSNGWHILLALFVSIILIPIFGHWSASSDFIARNPGWLEVTGFVDQAGSVRINAVAAWFAFILVLKLRPAPPQEDSGVFNNLAYSSSAILLLWLSWLGFTTGSLTVSEAEVSNVILNVSLAAAAGGLTAFLQNNFSRHKASQIEGGLGGFIAGLVAIAACAQSVSFAEAIVIGSSAGILQIIAFKLLHKFFLKQTWQARAAHIVSIHGVGGIWGGVCVALFATHGNFSSPNIEQLFVQLQGIMVAIIYSVLFAYVMVFILKLRKKTPTSELTPMPTPASTQKEQI